MYYFSFFAFVIRIAVYKKKTQASCHASLKDNNILKSGLQSSPSFHSVIIYYLSKIFVGVSTQKFLLDYFLY